MRLSIQNKKTRRNEDGFTLIEIVISLTVFMVAVMGMISLQGASINAATKARRHTAAVSIARYIITEFKTEFAGWDKVQTSTNFPPDGYPLLSSIFGSSDKQGEWIRFGYDLGGTLGDFRLDEFLGHSNLEKNDGASRFCVNYRADPLEILPGDADPEGNSAGEHSVWQVRVRVSWTKEGAFPVTDETLWKRCDPTNVEQRIVKDGSDDVVEILATATRELAR